jgi:hypothetical protein
MAIWLLTRWDLDTFGPGGQIAAMMVRALDEAAARRVAARNARDEGPDVWESDEVTCTRVDLPLGEEVLLTVPAQDPTD